MNEWELKKCELKAAVERGVKEWEASEDNGDYNFLSLYEHRAIARAAVRKVVEWLEKNDIVSELFEGEKDDRVMVDLDKGDLWIDRDEWQFLKATVEGE